MARRSIPIEEKIETQKELMEAFANSERSFEEVMRFLSGNEVDDE